MRYDLLLEAYCAELSRLLDQLRPEPIETVVQVVEEDLGKPLAACFRCLELEPLGSASIAQVHRAVLCSGERVVLKVKRPRIERRLRVNLLTMWVATYLLDRYGFMHYVGLRRIVGSLATSVRNELDFEREAHHTQFFHEKLA